MSDQPTEVLESIIDSRAVQQSRKLPSFSLNYVPHNVKEEMLEVVYVMHLDVPYLMR